MANDTTKTAATNPVTIRPDTMRVGFLIPRNEEEYEKIRRIDRIARRLGELEANWDAAGRRYSRMAADRRA